MAVVAEKIIFSAFKIQMYIQLCFETVVQIILKYHASGL